MLPCFRSDQFAYCQPSKCRGRQPHPVSAAPKSFEDTSYTGERAVMQQQRIGKQETLVGSFDVLLWSRFCQTEQTFDREFSCKNRTIMISLFYGNRKDMSSIMRITLQAVCAVRRWVFQPGCQTALSAEFPCSGEEFPVSEQKIRCSVPSRESFAAHWNRSVNGSQRAPHSAKMAGNFKDSLLSSLF